MSPPNRQEQLRGIEEIPERDAVMSHADGVIDSATLEMAKQLILNLSGKWGASKYHNEYTEIYDYLLRDIDIEL